MSAACGRMNLNELVVAHPRLFYSQSWYLAEAFMRMLPDDNAYEFPPRRVTHTGQVPKSGDGLPRAVDLAHAYVKKPDDAIWSHWLWTADTDKDGQRIFVGVQDGKFQIHRHLNVTMRFARPAW